jgi:putative membrane protein insertion efficiency factor
MTVVARGLCLLIRGYRLVSAGGIPRCRFYPTCSAYALETIEHHGVWKGLSLTLGRLLRCHPWHAGGYDPVHQSRY